MTRRAKSVAEPAHCRNRDEGWSSNSLLRFVVDLLITPLKIHSKSKKRISVDFQFPRACRSVAANHTTDLFYHMLNDVSALDRCSWLFNGVILSTESSVRIIQSQQLTTDALIDWGPLMWLRRGRDGTCRVKNIVFDPASSVFNTLQIDTRDTVHIPRFYLCLHWHLTASDKHGIWLDHGLSVI